MVVSLVVVGIVLWVFLGGAAVCAINEYCLGEQKSSQAQDAIEKI
jgi:hypothetical protein